MLKIELDDKLKPAVENGTKQVTIRAGWRGYQPGPALVGDVLVEITDVTLTAMDQIDLELAQADGFENRNDLLEGLQQYYPDLTWQSPITVVRFKRPEVRQVFAEVEMSGKGGMTGA